jgi:hypothetical protein
MHRHKNKNKLKQFNTDGMRNSVKYFKLLTMQKLQLSQSRLGLSVSSVPPPCFPSFFNGHRFAPSSDHMAMNNCLREATVLVNSKKKE